MFMASVIGTLKGENTRLSDIYKKVMKTFSSGDAKAALNELNSTFFTDVKGTVFCHIFTSKIFLELVQH